MTRTLHALLALIALLSFTRPLEAQSSSAPASDADVTAFLSEGSADANTPSLSVYGFSDFTVAAVTFDKSGTVGTFQGESPAFFVGNLNVYLAADLTKGFKSLAEVRFTYLPDGALDSQTFLRQSTAATDYASLGEAIHWGGIQIERVWVEYTAHSLLTLRVGQWLTPVGIWNVDHGTPTIIPVFRPYIIGAGLFPTRQTGFELYGSYLIGQSTLGYELTLSNGRGNLDSYLDYDKNKAVGARADLTVTAVGTLTIGASGYWGRSTDGNLDAMVANGDFHFANDILSQFDEVSYACDLLWRWHSLHLQSEWFINEVRYTAVGRVAPVIATNAGLVPDYERWGGYVLLGYRFDWMTLMPFATFELVRNPGAISDPGTVAYENLVGVGFNLRPVSSVALKLQLLSGELKYQPHDSHRFYQTLGAQIAWSF